MESHTQNGFGIHLYFFSNYIKSYFILIKVMSSKDTSISNNNIKWQRI